MNAMRSVTTKSDSLMPGEATVSGKSSDLIYIGNKGTAIVKESNGDKDRERGE